MPDEHWKIDRYARYTVDKSENGTQWIHYDDSSDTMTVMLSDVHQLVISQGSAILESHSLLSARAWMRGVSRNDSLLFVYRVQISGKAETRKFRVRFCQSAGSSGSTQCGACVDRLQQFFPVKTSVVRPPETTDGLQSNPDVTKDDGKSNIGKGQSLEGEVTLGDVAESVLSSGCLPRAYSLQQHTSQATLQQMLRMCLADPAFPGFVESVESELGNIVQEL